MLVWPAFNAYKRALKPQESIALMSAPRSMSNFAISIKPKLDAIIRGVYYVALLKLTSNLK